MTPLTLHAVGLARGGEWRLLDALEVIARTAEEPTLAGVMHCPGGLTLLGYSEDELGPVPAECPECGGGGELEAEGATGRTKWVVCPWCHGDGDWEEGEPSEPQLPVHRVKVWRTLSGARVNDVEIKDSGRWINRAGAAGIVKEYTGLVAALAGAA